MTKHYSPVTNNIESCVGQDRCKYGGNELAVHFADDEGQKAQEYMNKTNEKLFGLLPRIDQGSSNYSLGPYHTAESLKELKRLDNDYRLGEDDFSDVKRFAGQVGKELSAVKYDHEMFSEGANGPSFKALIMSYENMMEKLYPLEPGSLEKAEYDAFVNEDVPKARAAQLEFFEKHDSFYSKESEFTKIKLNKIDDPGEYRPPFIFGRSKYKENYNKKISEYEKYLSDKEKVLSEFNAAKKEYNDSLSRFVETSKVIFSKVESELNKIQKREDNRRREYKEKVRSLWESGFDKGQAPSMPKSWSNTDDMVREENVTS